MTLCGWGQPVRRNHRVPDGRWYGNAPRIFAEASGAEAEAMIPAIRSAIASPLAQEWRVPRMAMAELHKLHPPRARCRAGLEAAMPNTAIGAAYRSDGGLFGLTPSGTGIEFSVYGLAGSASAGRGGGDQSPLRVFGIDIMRRAQAAGMGQGGDVISSWLSEAS